MKLTASKLRADIYKILDRVAQKGETIELERKGTSILIAPKHKKLKKLKRLKKQSLTREDSDNFEHIDWSGEWQGSK